MWVHIPRVYSDQVIEVPIKTRQRERICCNVFHESKPNTVYFRTAPHIDGIQVFTIKIPKMPEGVILEIYNEYNGNRDIDPSYKVGKINVTRLVPNLTCRGIVNKTARCFMEFAHDFAEDAGWISAQNKIYEDPDKRFRIDYKYVIRDKNGREMTTPMRINGDTRIMEAAQKHMVGYTVGGRIGVLTHEFSHCWRNSDPSNEIEADRNAAFLYLSFGYPKAELIKTFTKVFYNMPSDINRQRTDEMINYIQNFDKIMASEIAA